MSNLDKQINEILTNCIIDDLKQRFSFRILKDGYSATLYANSLIRIDLKSKSFNRIIFKDNDDLIKYIPNKLNCKIKKEVDQESGKSIIIYWIDISKNIDELINVLNELKPAIINQQDFIFQTHASKEPFACCGFYEECSDAKYCIRANIDIEFYKRCLYRKNLESGHIFYGKNKNI